MAAPTDGAVHRQLLLILLLLVSPSLGLPRHGKPLEEEVAAAEAGGGRRACSYTVKIRTSCSSPRRTSDAVSVAFGDAYRNEVYAPRLAAGGSAAFERCATDTFRVSGPCGYSVCYLYLRRAGRDGWTPEWVQVTEPNGATTTFYYGDPLPDSVWYGYNRCPRVTAPLAAAGSAPSVV